MRDMNFFSGYIEQKKFAGQKYHKLLMAALIIVVVVGGLYAATIFVSMHYKNSTADMITYLDSAEVKEKLKVVDREKNQIALINEYSDIVDKVMEGIDRADIIDSKLMESINKVVPPVVTFKSSQFSGNQISFTGSAISRIVVAEFYHNLTETGLFSDVYLGSLQSENPTAGPFDFVIICTVKGGIQE